MKGQIAISKLEVEKNNMGWNVFDFFNDAIKEYKLDQRAGWYAYILRDDIYYFLWADGNEWATEEYLDLLEKDGYTLAYPISSQQIQDHFK